MSIKMAKFMKKIYEESKKEGGDILKQLFGEPLFDANNTKKYKEELKKLAKLNRPPFPSQVEQGVIPIKEALEKYKAAILLGEMGIGKTQISFSVIPLLKMKKRKILFLTTGSKHLRKMEREAKEILGDKVNVYIIVNNNPRRRKKEILPEEVKDINPKKGEYAVFLMSKDTAKTSLKEEPVIEWGQKCPFCNNEVWPASWKKEKIEKAKTKGQKPAYKLTHCSKCGTNLLKKVAKNIVEGNLIFKKRVQKNKKYKGVRRISIGERLKRITKSKTDKVFDYLIIDEAHEMQNPFSLQSTVYRQLVRVSHKTLIMTGTLTNGYTSSLYYILYPILSWYFKQKGYDFYDVSTFVEHYGQKKLAKEKEITDINKGKGSIRIQELPRISERIISFLAPFTTWIKIEDLNIKMPTYKEEAITVNQLPIIKESLNWYVENVINVIACISNVNINYISNFALRVMYILNNPFVKLEFEIMSNFNSTHDYYNSAKINLLKLDKKSFIDFEEVVIKKTEKEEIKKIKLKIKFPGINQIIREKNKTNNQTNNQEEIMIESTESETKDLSENVIVKEETILPKEKVLIDRIKTDLKNGRNVLLYTIYNNVAKVDQRLYKILLQENIVSENEIAILPNVAAEKIEEWIEEHPVKILIASPIKLATGLDLVQFPSIKFYETGTNLRVIQQASRRSWRAVGQKYPVTVEFYAYEGIQSKLLELIGKKLRAAATVDGRKVDNSQLSHVFDDNKDLTRVLNKIAEEVEKDTKANFTNIYQENKLRPLTKLEAEYQKLLEEYKESQMDIQIKDLKEKEEIFLETFEKSNENLNLFDFVQENENEEEDFFEIKIKKRGNQYVFDF